MTLLGVIVFVACLVCAVWCYAACAVAGMSDDDMATWEAETWKQD